MTAGTDELCLLDATELARLIRAKHVSPRAVVDAFLDRIDACNPHLNALCVTLHESARAAAADAEQRLMSGDELGPLHGVPIAFKDMTETRGVRTTFGSKVFEHNVPTTDAIVVERALRAGAIMIGKTQSPEFAHSGFSRNLVFGAARNPWDLERTPGGSSGGSAAAVAAALTPLAEGSDGAGSVRIPAAACGIFGLKPQFGRVPLACMDTHFETLVCFGPMTWTVRDAALLLSVWAGADDRDPMSLPDEATDYVHALEGDVTGARVAYIRSFGLPIDPRVSAVVDDAVKTVEGLGCSVDEVTVEGGREALETLHVLWFTMMAAMFGQHVSEHRHEMTRRVLEQIENGERISAVEYVKAQVWRSRFYDQMADILRRYDFIVAPTLAIPAPSVHSFSFGPEEIDGEQVDRQMGWFLTYFFNLTMHPVATVPVGFTDDGLPVGMQIGGRRFADGGVLRFSARMEEARPWGQRRPPEVTAWAPVDSPTR